MRSIFEIFCQFSPDLARITVKSIYFASSLALPGFSTSDLYYLVFSFGFQIFYDHHAFLRLPPFPSRRFRHFFLPLLPLPSCSFHRCHPIHRILFGHELSAFCMTMSTSTPSNLAPFPSDL